MMPRINQHVAFALLACLGALSGVTARALAPVAVIDVEKAPGNQPDSSIGEALPFIQGCEILNLSGEQLTFTILQHGLAKEVFTLRANTALHFRPASEFGELIVSNEAGQDLASIEVRLANTVIFALRSPRGIVVRILQ